MTNEYATTVDGKSYFYQLPIAAEVGTMFAANLTDTRGEFTSVAMTRCPMGWSYAPWVAMQVSKALLRDEDETVVEGFLAAHPEFELEPARDVLGAGGEAVCEGPYLRVYPQRVAGGGFFGARMRRKG